jgi:hypothetical protein
MTTESIRMLIREMLLTEAMYTPERAAEEGIIFTVKKTRFGHGGWKISCGPIGEIIMQRSLGIGNCLGAYEVILSGTDREGLGPLLYDIAMEIAGDAGIMSDRAMVSPEARRVWDYYLNNRPDVTSNQLDSRPGTITPDDEEDDCSQSSARVGGRNWQKSPLSKVYRKSGTPVIDRLRELGIIEIVG